jgi:hypothetical protein
MAKFDLATTALQESGTKAKLGIRSRLAQSGGEAKRAIPELA